MSHCFSIFLDLLVATCGFDGNQGTGGGTAGTRASATRGRCGGARHT